LLFWYTAILEEDGNSVKILTNRSYAYSLLGLHSAAIRDAEKAIIVDPGWIKGYFRLAVGYIGNAQYTTAKEILNEGLARCVGVNDTTPDEFKNLLNEIDSFLTAATTPPLVAGTFPFQLTDIPCHTKVKYSQTWFIIDPSGNYGHYTTITNAIHDLACHQQLKAFTLILLPGKHFDQINLQSLPNSVSIQILGWFPTDEKVKPTTSSPCSIIHGYTPDNTPTRRFVHPDYVLMQIGSHCQLDLQDIFIRQPVTSTNVGSCLFCKEHVIITVSNCKFESHNSPSLMIRDKGSTVELNNCSFMKVSAGMVVGYDGNVTVKDCKFAHCTRSAIEIRTGGQATISNCHFDDCKMQAITLYQQGKRITVSQCTIKRCGNHSQYGSMLVETGYAVISGCQFLDIPGDGIVVQESTQGTSEATDPVVIIRDCLFRQGNKAIAMFYGRGSLVNNTLQAMSSDAIFIQNLVRTKKLIMRGNVFDGNGSGDIMIMGDTMFRENVVYEQVGGKVKLMVIPDSLAEMSMRMTLQSLHRKGMQ
jgi:hypothetical protein